MRCHSCGAQHEIDFEQCSECGAIAVGELAETVPVGQVADGIAVRARKGPAGGVAGRPRREGADLT